MSNSNTKGTQLADSDPIIIQYMVADIRIITLYGIITRTRCSKTNHSEHSSNLFDTPRNSLKTLRWNYLNFQCYYKHLI